MPLTEFQSKEALRSATDWLVASDLPGAGAAREGIASVIPLIMMGEIAPEDLDELASIVEDYGRSSLDPNAPEESARLKEAVTAAFQNVKQS